MTMASFFCDSTNGYYLVVWDPVWWFGLLEFCYERDCYFSGYPPGNYCNISPTSQQPALLS